jgi:hypothetical protein
VTALIVGFRDVEIEQFDRLSLWAGVEVLAGVVVRSARLVGLCVVVVSWDVGA